MASRPHFLVIGSTLSHYQITAELGRGGMGIVYKATDTKLNRTVAVKVIPSSALASDEDRTRFYREAQAAAQLHHAHIATIFEIDEAVPSGAPHGTQPSPFIVMEYIEGETLDTRIKKGPLKLDEVIRVASEIAAALEQAHAKEIVHRDIKSANVMLTQNGEAKVLDFGLAKTAQSTQLTRMGSTLGTVAYMSPEQARGEVVDTRTDLWALGVVIYEMIAGVNPFGGDYEQAVIYGILNTDPEPLTALRTGVPMEMEAITTKCLRKEASKRYQTTADLIADLSAIVLVPPSGRSVVERSSLPSSGKHSFRAWWAISLVGALLLVFWMGRMTVTPPGPDRLDVSLRIPSLESVFNGYNVSLSVTLALSPDGSKLAFLGADENGNGLYIVDLSTRETPRRLANTWAKFPSFSGDGKSLAFAGPGGVFSVPTRGGEPTRITSQIEDATGTSWGADGYVYFIPNYGGGIWRVRPEHPIPEQVIQVRPELGERGFTCVSLAPDQQSLLVGRYGPSGLAIVLIDITSGDRTTLTRGVCPAFAGNDRILYSQGARLSGARLHADNSLSNETTITENLFVDRSSLTAEYAASGTGNLVFIEGTNESGRSPEVRRFDGSTELIDIGKDEFHQLALSPDGELLALTSPVSAIEDLELFVYDINQGDLRQLTTTNSWEGYPIWTSDSESIVYGSESSGQADIYEISMLGEERLVYADSLQKYPGDVSTDGRFLVMDVPTTSQDNDVFVLDRDSNTMSLVVGGPGDQQYPDFSPDDRFIAYQSDETGSSEIFIVDFPPSHPRRKISTNGGRAPTFSRGGEHLYFESGSDLVRVQLNSSGRRLSDPEVVLNGVTDVYVLLPDNSGIITREPPEIRTIRLMKNWTLDEADN